MFMGCLHKLQGTHLFRKGRIVNGYPRYPCIIPESNFKIKTGDWKSFSMKWQIVIGS